MSKIHEIPVAAEAAAVEAVLNASIVLALVAEIEAKLDALASVSEESTIDLRCLLGMPAELASLRELLGQGEVAATVTTVGASTAQETAVPCVWWISHRDPDGGKLGEFIEIAEVPDLLRSDRLSIGRGLEGLRARSARLGGSAAAFPSTLGSLLS